MNLINKNDKTVPMVVQGRTSVSPAQAFDTIVPIDLSLIFTGWHGVFPGVRGSKNQTGSWDHVGASRNPDLSDGTTATESLVEYSRPSSFAYTLVDFTNVLGSLAEGVRGEWTFTPDGDGTLIRWVYEFKPLRGRGTLVRRLLAPTWQRYMAQCLAQAIEVTERTRAQESQPARVA